MSALVVALPAKESDVPKESSLRVAIVSLGCAKNLVDSEEMLGWLGSDGFILTSCREDADVVIINTCTFIKQATQESLNTIREFIQWRDQHRPGQAIVVAGCLAQRYRNQIAELVPGVDLIMGLEEVGSVVDLVRIAFTHRQNLLSALGKTAGARAVSGDDVEQYFPALSQSVLQTIVKVSPRVNYLLTAESPRLLLTPPHYAYVKIAEGCDHACSFCVIPQIRGRYRSRPVEDIVQEVTNLVRYGVKEVNLIAQDTTYYGWETLPGHLRPKTSTLNTLSPITRGSPIVALLKELEKIEGDFWIRLLYTHPGHWTEELIEHLAQSQKTVAYADIPIQHIHPAILERMRRNTSKECIEFLIERIRASIPHIAIRTTFIVGFPGETDECFEEVVQFLKRVQFDWVGAFVFSEEEGTRAAALPDQVPYSIRLERLNRLLGIQRAISKKRLAGKIGSWRKTLVERRCGTKESRRLLSEIKALSKQKPEQITSDCPIWIGRSYAEAPDVDGRIYLIGKAKAGQFVQARVIASTDYDLVAVIEPDRSSIS